MSFVSPSPCSALSLWSLLILVFFFFQAEDGIRDLIVTGVQTCALPILVAVVCFDYLDDVFALYVLVLYLADDRFEYVFDRDESRETTVLVNHERELHVNLLHLFQKFVNRFRFRHEVGGAQKRLYQVVLAPLGPVREQVADVDDADNVLYLFAVDGQARILRLDYNVTRGANGCRDGQRDDVRARSHNLARLRLAELDDVLYEFALFLFEYALLLANVYERLYVAAVVVRVRVRAFRAGLCHVLCAASSARGDCLTRHRGEREHAVDGAVEREQRQQHALRVARRDEARDDLPEDYRQGQRDEEGEEEETPFRAEQLKRDRGDEHDHCDE